jgi:hypothetical protein
MSVYVHIPACASPGCISRGGVNIHQSTIHILCCDFLESVCSWWYRASGFRKVVGVVWIWVVRVVGDSTWAYVMYRWRTDYHKQAAPSWLAFTAFGGEPAGDPPSVPELATTPEHRDRVNYPRTSVRTQTIALNKHLQLNKQTHSKHGRQQPSKKNPTTNQPTTNKPANQPSPHQLDRFVGLAMLILASTVFAYYTVWTLLMVHGTLLSDNQTTHQLTLTTALRRRLALHPNPLPTPRLGHSHSRDPPAARRCRGRKFLERGNGAEQSQESGEGCEGDAAEGAVRRVLHGCGYLG